MQTGQGTNPSATEVLIVEDSPTQAELLRHLLEQRGYKTHVANSGKAALELLRANSNSVRVILSDIIMPEMDGYGLAAAVKKDPDLKKIPVILLTSLSDPEDILRGLDARVDSYLTKPCDEAFLVSKIESVLAAPFSDRGFTDAQQLEVNFRGRAHTVNLNAEHALNLLLSTYENAVYINDKLLQTQMELEALNHDLLDANDNLKREVGERKRAEEEVRTLNEELEGRVTQRTAELEMSNQELKDFAYVVSHDLKAPLRAVSQLAGWLAEDYKEVLDDPGKELITMLMGRLDRMHNLIEGILQYSRIGRIKEEETEVDLDALARDLADILAPPENVSIQIEGKLPTVKFERTRAEQVLQNLMSNAIKFMDKPQGLIRIVCAETDDEFVLSVSDNGPGIDEKYHKKIFQIFQTLAPRDEFESTGIGLTLVKKIMDISSGRIWLESEPGQGTTFHCTFKKK